MFVGTCETNKVAEYNPAGRAALTHVFRSLIKDANALANRATDLGTERGHLGRSARRSTCNPVTGHAESGAQDAACTVSQYFQGFDNVFQCIRYMYRISTMQYRYMGFYVGRFWGPQIREF